MKSLFIIFFITCVGAEECGRTKVGTAFSIGSEYATKGQWPWMAPLFYHNDDKFFCGSTIISKQHLLSASHCFKNKGDSSTLAPNRVYSLLGIHDLNKTDERGIIRAQISNIIIHSDWSSQKETYDGDIAILRLVNKLVFTNYIQPVCLPSSNMNVFEVDGTVVGYGLSDDTAEAHEMKPKFVRISSITQEDCLIGRDVIARISSKRMFCAGSIGKNPCRGDSGGGFHVKLGGSYFIVGIISSSVYRECHENEFVLFTNVPKFISWVNREISGNSIAEWKLEPLKCEYEENIEYERFECFSPFTLRSLESNVKISSIVGMPTNGKTFNDVNTVIIKQAKVTFIPDMTIVTEKFTNFNEFYIVLCGLKFIERAKLSKMPKLKNLNFYGNDIEHFDEDVFDDLRNLEILAFVNNKIKILPQKLIWNLINLKEIWSYTNPIEAIPIRFFKNNKKIVKAWMGYSKIKRIEVNFKALPNLELLDLRENVCIDLQFCKSCGKLIEDVQDKIDEQCGPESTFVSANGSNAV